MNREQFTIHVERSQKALRRFLVALCCGDSLLADDIAQESYMKAYLSTDGLTDEAKFNSWIFRIAYNTFVSNCRTRRPVESLDSPAAMQAEADSRADSAFRYQALYAALRLLSEKERTAILLYYLEGYSVSEIAVIVESSPEAVRQQLSRGRSHLRDLLTTT